MASFESLLMSLMDGRNVQRGEAAINEMQDQQPDELITQLVMVIVRVDAHSDLRQMAAIILRRIMCRARDKLWSKINPSSQNALKIELLNVLKTDATAEVLYAVSELISVLANGLLPNGEWPDLLPFLLQLSQQQSNIQRECAFQCFCSLINVLRSKLQPYYGEFSNLLVKGISDNDPKVRLAALNGLSTFLFLANQEVGRFQPLIPNIIETITLFIRNANYELARTGLSYLIELAENNTLFLRPSLTPIADFSFNVATNNSIEDATRYMGVEVLITIAEARPGLVRQEGSIMPRLVPLLLEMLHDISENPDWNEGEAADIEDENSKVGSESIERLANVIGGATLVPMLFQHVPNMLANQNWRQRHAALMAISIIGEGCNEYVKDILRDVVKMAHPHLMDQHPRVRWAACTAIGQLATDFSPEFQKMFHAEFLPSIGTLLEDSQNPRVQSHASAAILNFCEHATADLVVPHMHGLLERFNALLVDPKKIVLEQCMTAIASIANATKENFLPYYDSFVPFFKSVLHNATSRDMRYLRGRAMEAISLIATAVGPEKFGQDAQEVIEVMMHIQRSPMDADDPQLTYLQFAWIRIAKTITKDFVPYLPAIIPPLIKNAALKPEIVLCSAADTDRYEDNGNWQLIPFGENKVALNTTMLETKSAGCNSLACYVEELKEHFFQYVDEVARILLPLVSFFYHDGVRSAACSSLPHLLRCKLLHFTKKGEDPRAHVQSAFNAMLPDILQGLDLEMNIDILIVLIESFAACIDVAGANSLSDASLMKVSKAILALLNDFYDRRDEREKRRQEDDFDEGEQARLEAEHKREEEVLVQVAEVIGRLAHTHKERYLGFFNDLVYNPLFGRLLAQESRPQDRQAALCVFDDVVEFAGPAAGPFYANFLNTFMAYSMDEFSIVRQSAVYGLGVMAQFAGDTIVPHVNDILERLRQLIVHPSAHEEDCVAVTENAVSAMSKILYFHGSHVPAEPILSLIVQELPLTHDCQEGPVVHQHLCEYIQKSPELVFGAEYQNLAKILFVFANVIGTGFATADTQQLMRQHLHSMQTSIAGDVLQGAFAQLSDELKAKLQAIVSA